MQFQEQAPTLHPASDARLGSGIDRLGLSLHCAVGILALLTAWVVGL